MKKNNPKEEAIRARRKAFYSKAWDVQLDPKKMHNQDLKNNMRKWIRQADEERYKSLKSLKPKKPIPKVDLPSISKGISNYMELNTKTEFNNLILFINFVIGMGKLSIDHPNIKKLY